MPSPSTEIEVGSRAVRISNPDRVYFSTRGETKLDLVNYYLSVGDGIVRALRDRPCMLHRYPDGVDGHKISWTPREVVTLASIPQATNRDTCSGVAPESRITSS